MIIDKELHDITQDHEKQKLPFKIRLNNQQETFFFFFQKKFLPLKSQENTQDAYIKTHVFKQ
jgi:hypothetical protein